MVEPAKRLPGSLAATPRISRWISIGADGFVTVTPGKVELGQGLSSALAQIVAEELDVPLPMVRLRPAETGVSPNEGVTSGSLSIRDCGMALRQVGAEVRALYMAEAALRLICAPQEIAISDGLFRGPGNRTLSYGDMAFAVSLDRDATGQAPPKPPDERTVAGRSSARIDIPGRVFGTRGYIHDVVLPDMLHGHVVHPPRPGARLASCDEARFRASAPEAILVRDGSFIGVVCATERAATKAAQRLVACTTWDGGNALPDMHDLAHWLTTASAETETVAEHGVQGGGVQGDGGAADGDLLITRDFIKPFLAHGSIGPSCALARWSNDALHVITHSQGVYNLRDDLAIVFELPADRITVVHAEGAGCYGHNGADDVALDAALLARATPGRTVRVQWTRADELAQAPFGAAMLVRISAGLTPEGRISTWRHTLWSNGHTARPGRSPTPALLAARNLATPWPPFVAVDPPLWGGGGAHRNAVPAYEVPDLTVIKHRLLDQPIRTSSMRSLGAIANVFAIECVMDELAERAGQDALAFRLAHLSDPRARDALQRAAGMAGWGQARVQEGRGRGLAFARYKNSSGYCAVVAEVDADAEPRATRLWIAADVGEVINPDGAVNQIEGGALQSVSWALKEEVRFTRSGMSLASWEDYPILRFSEVPEIEVALLARPSEPPLGAGEIAQGPVAAALANAIHAALGTRMQRMPFTRESIIAALEHADA